MQEEKNPPKKTKTKNKNKKNKQTKTPKENKTRKISLFLTALLGLVKID